MSCRIDNRQSDSWKLGTTAYINNSWIKMSGSKSIYLNGLNIQLPLRLSMESKKPNGSAKINKIFYNKKLIGSLEGQLRREENSVVYKGRCSNKKAPESTLAVYGIIGRKGFQIMWHNFQRQSFKELQPHKFSIKFAGINMMGTTYEDHLNGIIEEKFP
jgi:hypothetical protein